ncbi:hypothetical protein [Novosphingobium sp. TH158]|uniref:hypothetical protein n=1 Tax=Novosphingobium sp. TH158 TaxID=2067455 RepID=UPI001C1FA5A1|nr:hypothetical protein [Novosphingobium sp. TH158]
MRSLSLVLTAVLLASAPALARGQQQPAAKMADQDRPVTDPEVTAGDVATTPLSDLNLKKGEIPPQLIAAQNRPYDLAGMSRCQNIAAAVGELDVLLGEDIDIVDSSGSTSTGKLAQSVVGAFIPFRGVIREVSGANSQERRLQIAIRAGMARRSFLKGVGLQRRCRYPARPATPQIAAMRLAQIAAADPKDKDKQAAARMAADEAAKAQLASPAKKQRRRKR